MNAAFISGLRGRLILLLIALLCGLESHAVLAQPAPTQQILLPSNTVFINQPPSEWEEHPEAIVAVLAFILVQAVLIFVLFTSNRRRRSVETQLGASDEKLRAIFDCAIDGIMLVDAETRRLVTGNAALCRMLGYSLEELTGLGVSDIHPPQDLPHVMEALARQLRGEIRLAANIPVKRKDGSVFFADINSAPANVNGKPCLVGIFRDVSERNQADAALQESEQRFHDIIDASGDWIWEVDARARYTFVSSSVTNLLGYTPAEILGKTPFDLMLPEEAERVRLIFAEIAAKGLPFRNLDNINVHKDGSLRHVLTNGMPIRDDQGQVIGYRGLDMDATERIQAEMALREQTEELRRRNDELERFNRATVGRELAMIALKQMVNDLSRQLGQEPLFSLAFLDEPDKSDPDAPPS